MALNKTKVDRLHDLLPKHLHSRTNVNWKGLIEAIGEADQMTADLVAEVRKQFFVKTASRPYIDRLAANHRISRPRLIGMSDASFRDYIPVLSYKPKQVKLIIDALLDIFFFKESTTAYITSQSFQPFALESGWELEYKVDNMFSERIVFDSSDFTDISSATADEIVGSFNRQAKYSYATNYYDSITKKNFIRIFTNTVGSKGSIELTGGRANIALRLDGFIDTSGAGSNTQWTVTKVGDITTFQHTGGASPGIENLRAGDILISDINGNKGSFPILEVNISSNLIKFKNLFSTVGVFSQTSARQTKFIRPNKYVAFTSLRRAMTWETSPGEVVVEMPTTPPVVQRSLKGSLHLNGVFSLMTNRNSATSLTVADATGFPKSGTFIIEPVNSITTRIVTPDVDEVVERKFNGRLIYNVQKYTYASRVVLSTVGSVNEGENQITVNSVAGLSNGMTIFMDGIRGDAVITNISGLVVTSSVPATKTLVGATVEFGGNTLTGITPNLPLLGNLNEINLTALTRAGNVVTATTPSTHDYAVGESVVISGSSGINVVTTTGDITSGSNVVTNLATTSGIAPGELIIGAGIPDGTKVIDVLSATSVLMSANATATSVGLTLNFNEDLNGGFTIQTIGANTFTYNLIGTSGSAVTPGQSRLERLALANADSKIILTKAQNASDTRITGPYVWDKAAQYVLSSATALTQTPVQAGTITRLVTITDNEVPDEAGFLVFSYGLNNQEGPIRYLYKPNDNTLAIDPSYVFQNSHPVGSPVVVLRQKGPHTMDTRAGEYGPYITDPSQARDTLQELIRSVKSAGIFVNFLVRFPEQLYGTIDVYGSGVDPG